MIMTTVGLLSRERYSKYVHYRQQLRPVGTVTVLSTTVQLTTRHVPGADNKSVTLHRLFPNCGPRTSMSSEVYPGGGLRTRLLLPKQTILIPMQYLYTVKYELSSYVFEMTRIVNKHEDEIHKKYKSSPENRGCFIQEHTSPEKNLRTRKINIEQNQIRLSNMHHDSVSEIIPPLVSLNII